MDRCRDLTCWSRRTHSKLLLRKINKLLSNNQINVHQIGFVEKFLLFNYFKLFACLQPLVTQILQIVTLIFQLDSNCRINCFMVLIFVFLFIRPFIILFLKLRVYIKTLIILARGCGNSLSIAELLVILMYCLV